MNEEQKRILVVTAFSVFGGWCIGSYHKSKALEMATRAIELNDRVITTNELLIDTVVWILRDGLDLSDREELRLAILERVTFTNLAMDAMEGRDGIDG